MKGNCHLHFLLFCSVFLALPFLDETEAAEAGNDIGVYIVYMGATVPNGSLKEDHVQLMNWVSRW